MILSSTFYILIGKKVLSMKNLDLRIYEDAIEIPEWKKHTTDFIIPKKTEVVPLKFIEKIIRYRSNKILYLIATDEGFKKMDLKYKKTDVYIGNIRNDEAFITALETIQKKIDQRVNKKDRSS
jgi:hypothetical protein